MRFSLQHPPLSAYLSNVLIITVGSSFALLCVLLVLIEWVIELIAVPIIFFITLTVLAYGWAERKFGNLRRTPRPVIL